MGREIILSLNDALYNAGILGFYKIVQASKLPVKVEGANLSFDSSILENFEQHYTKVMIETYRDEAAFEKIRRQFREYDPNVVIEKDDDEFLKKSLERFIKSASYSSAYEIIKTQGEPFEFLEMAKKAKTEKNYSERRILLGELLEKMEAYADIFLMKDIIYTKINSFWSNVAFLNSKNNRQDMTGAFRKSFIEPIDNFINKPSKPTKECFQCLCPISKGNASPMSWLKNMGVDLARKTNYFWNMQPDGYICPICALMYSCLPLGFLLKNNEGIFINENSSVKNLQELNGVAKIQMKGQSKLFFNIIDNIIQQRTADKELQNIQVVRLTSNGYRYNTLSKDKLLVLEQEKKNLESLAKVVFKIDKEYINVYQETINGILNNQNMYLLVYKLMNEALKTNKNMYFVKWILAVQRAMRERSEQKVEKNEMHPMADTGNELRKKLDLADREHKIRGLSYQLLNHLKTRNVNDFMDIIFRQYIGMGLSIPTNMNRIANGTEEDFLDYGYNFLLGLNGGAIDYKKENDKDRPTQKGVNE